MTTMTDPCIEQVIAEISPTIHHIAEELWRLAEISHQEERSAQMLMKILQERGFRIISKGTAGVPTAFLAEYGTGSPRIGLLAEYDALPGLGNEPVPYRQPRLDKISSGHGCGHNLLGAGCIGAALALKALMEREQLAGTIRVYGCAAEETEGAKIFMARDGLFTDLDAALHWHPDALAQTVHFRSLALGQIQVEFFGTSAHAALAPWQGRSALHAAEMFAHGLNLMREHLEPTARLHYTLESGGTATNVVPEYARLCVFVRETTRPRVREISHWITQIAEAAAHATQVTSQTHLSPGLYDLLPNRPLAERMQIHFQRVGVPAYTQEEQAFARELQQQVGVEQHGMSGHIQRLGDERFILSASTDVGNVSWNTPTAGLTMPTMPLGVAVHTWAATASHGTSLGVKGALHAAHVLTLLGLDILTDPVLRRDARADFVRRVADHPYVSPLPSEMTTPPSRARQKGRSEESLLQWPLGTIKRTGDEHGA